MRLYKKTLSVILVSALTLVGCSQKPNQMIIAPDVRAVSSNAFAGYSAKVSVEDLRTHLHIIEVKKEGKASHLVSNANDFATALKQQLTQALKTNQLQISPSNQQQFAVTINQAYVKVAQSLSRYKANSKITLTVQVNKGDSTLTKTYNSKSSSEGLLTADMAVLERDFNQQLGALITQIVNDTEIHQFVRS